MTRRYLRLDDRITVIEAPDEQWPAILDGLRARGIEAVEVEEPVDLADVAEDVRRVVSIGDRPSAILRAPKPGFGLTSALLPRPKPPREANPDAMERAEQKRRRKAAKLAGREGG